MLFNLFSHTFIYTFLLNLSNTLPHNTIFTFPTASVFQDCSGLPLSIHWCAETADNSIESMLFGHQPARKKKQNNILKWKTTKSQSTLNYWSLENATQSLMWPHKKAIEAKELWDYISQEENVWLQAYWSEV